MTPDVLRLLLYEASRAISYRTLSRGMTHDLRSPLQGIGLSAQVISSEDDLDTAIRIAEGIPATVHSMQTLVNRLPGLFESPGDTTPEPVDLTGFMRNFESLLQLQRGPGSCDLEVRADPGLPAVRAIPGYLEHLLLNLIINAREAADPSVIILEVTRQGGGVTLQVRDTGVGVLPGIQTTMFQPFMSTRGGDRLGLGLPVARDLAERQGGRLDYIPTDAVTVFQLTLAAWDSA